MMKNSNEAHAVLSAPSGEGETDVKQRAHLRTHLTRECPAPLVLHSRARVPVGYAGHASTTSGAVPFGR